MTKKLQYLFFILLLSCLIGTGWCFGLFTSPSDIALLNNPSTKIWVTNKLNLITRQTSNVDPKVLRLGLLAYLKAHKEGLDNKEILTIIDFSLPSTQKRLWVFNLKTGRTLFNTWVSHGKNSGTNYTNSFSNLPGSLKSSLGVFVTDTPYIGGKGYSLRIRGLEHGINDNAYKRHVVIHGAKYVNQEFITRSNQLGRSWGCPAVSDKIIRPLIEAIKGKTVLIAYYPDRSWIAHSKFLSG